MDKTTLKATIVELKENGMSFSEISKELEDKFDIKMTRQAVCGMYNRIVSKNNDSTNIVLVKDICTYKSLGLSDFAIRNILKEHCVDVTSSYIKTVIDDKLEYIEDIKNDYVDRVSGMLDANIHLTSIINSMEYKGVKPTSNCIDEIIERASSKLLNDTCMEVLVNLYRNISDSNLIRKLISKYNMDIEFRDVKRESFD